MSSSNQLGSSEEVELVPERLVRVLMDRLTNQEGQLVSVLTGSWDPHCSLEQEGKG